MKWLLTVSKDVDLSTASGRLAKHGAVVEYDPIPLGGHEQVLEVDGPDDLPERLDDEAWVKKTNTNSEQTLY